MPAPPDTHAHTVLLIEDDAGTREALCTLLVAHQCTVVSARSADDALTLVRREPRPCVILLDLMMSGIGGAEFRRAQLADTTVRDIPVILVSGARDLARRAEELLVAAYIGKPLDMDELLGAIGRHCAATDRGAARA